MEETDVFGPFEAAEICIDESCTIASILDPGRQRVTVKLLQFEYKVVKSVASEGIVGKADQRKGMMRKLRSNFTRDLTDTTMFGGAAETLKRIEQEKKE